MCCWFWNALPHFLSMTCFFKNLENWLRGGLTTFTRHTVCAQQTGAPRSPFGVESLGNQCFSHLMFK